MNRSRRVQILLAGASALILVLLAHGDCFSNVIVGLVIDPATTAGGGATSTRSGPGTWQLYIADDNADSFGILTYSVQLASVTEVEHLSPVTTISDAVGELYPAGFNFLRSLNDDPWVHASQNLSADPYPFYIRRFGQQAGDFSAAVAAIQPGSLVVGPSTSSAWGNYDAVAPYHGRNWLFLAEGSYSSGMRPAVTKATFNIFSSSAGDSNRLSQGTFIYIPEPATLCLLAVGSFGCLISRRR